MLKQSSESKFNSLVTEPLPYHLPLFWQHSPMDPGVS